MKVSGGPIKLTQNFSAKEFGSKNWEPRSKTIAAVVVIAGVIGLNSPLLVGVSFMLVLVTALAMGLSWRYVLARLLLLVPFLLFMSVPLVLGGGWPPAPAYYNFAILLVLKVLTSALVLTIMLTTQPLQEYLDGLANMKVPALIITVLFLTYRYVFLLGEELKNLQNALRSRLFQPGCHKKALRVYGELAGGLLIKAVDRSENVYQAMASRCFSGRLPVSKSRPVTKRDILKSLLAVAAIMLLIVIERWWLS